MDKLDLRNQNLLLRNQLSLQEKKAKDKLICENLLDYIQNLNPKVVHTYLPMDSEIDFYAVIDYLLKQKITVVCPKTLDKPLLQHLVLKSLDQLEDGRYGTKFPSGENEYHGIYDLIIVPGLAYNSQKYRLGYGGGYYDHFLKSQPNAIKLGLFYSFQKYEDLPVESHDIALDIVMTDLSE